MKTFLRILLRVLAGLFIAAVVTGLWFTGTTSGLASLVTLAGTLGPEVAVGEIEGSLLDGAVLRDVELHTEKQDVRISRLTARCDCALLLFGIIDLPEVRAEGVHVSRRPERETRKPRPPSLPLFLRIGELVADEVHVDGRLRLEHLGAEVSAGPGGVTVRDAAVVLPAARLEHSGTLRIGSDWQIRLDSRWSAAFGSDRRASGAARAEGDPARLTAQVALESPAPARLDLTARDLFGDRQWQASLRAPRGPLARMDDGLPGDIEAGLEAKADGRGKAWHAAGTLVIRQAYPDAPPVPVAFSGASLPDDPARFWARARWEDARWQAGKLAFGDLAGELSVEKADGPLRAGLRSHFSAAGTPGEVEVEAISEEELIRIPAARVALEDGGTLQISGAVRTGGPQPDVALDATWDGLSWPPGAPGQVVLRAGSARVEGTPDDWSAEIRGRAEGERIPPAAIEAALAGTREAARVETLRVGLLGGTVTASGRAAWRPAPALELSWNAAGLNPGTVWERWPGAIRGEGTAAWQAGRAAVEATLAGRLRGNDVHAGAKVALADKALNIENLVLRSGTAELQLSGTLGDTLDLAWRIDAPQLAAVHPDAAGDLHGEGTVSGTRDAPAIDGTLRAAGVSTPWAGAEELFADVDLDAQSGKTTIGVAGSGLAAGRTRIERVRFDLQGTRAQHEFRLDANAPKWEARLQGTGSSTKPGSWEGSLWDIALDSERLGHWALEAPLPARYVGDALSIGEACLARGTARLCPRLTANAEREWTAALRVEGMPVDLISSLAPRNVAIHGTWDFEAAAEGKAARIRHAEGRLATHDAGLELDIRESEPYRVGVTNGAGRFELDEGVLRSELGLAFDDPALRPFSAALTLAPIHDWPPDPERVRVEGRLEGGLRGLGFLAAASPLFEDVRGALSLDITVDGTLADPLPRGKFSLADGSFRLPELGTAIQEVTLRGEDRAPGEMAFSGGMTSGIGRLEVEGQVSGLPESPAARAEIRGERFEIVNLPEAWALVSPELEVDVAEGSATAGGRVLVPEARIDLDEVVVAPSLSEDVVVKGEEKEASMTRAGRFGAEVEVVLGDKVEITGRGLKGRLAGSLRIDAPAGRKPLADGEIRIVDGTYSAYGQSLEIEEGRIVYTRAELDNPQLDVRAARKVGDVTAGVAITGRLTSPRISLFSSPAMSQEQILAYVVLGRPLSQVGAGEGSSLVDAASTMGLQNSGFLTSSLASTFGLDTVSVETEGTAETASLVIGKYLSPRLYLSYGIGVFEAMSTARLRYDLTDSWALQAESSDEVGVDLFYKINTGVP